MGEVAATLAPLDGKRKDVLSDLWPFPVQNKSRPSNRPYQGSEVECSLSPF